MSLLGHTNSKGELRKDGRDKMAQVLAFIPLWVKVLRKTSRRRTLRVLECASGKGHLSLLLNQIISETSDRDIQWIGIDTSARLIGRCRSIAKQMGYGNVEYRVSRILDFSTDDPVDVLISLHACDTATDEALVKALELSVRQLFLVPCCQREVLLQISKAEAPLLLPLLQDPTHRRMFSTLLTDAMRRLVLESFGYEVDIFEYVSVRKTEKNLMIRGERGKLPDEGSWELYRRVRDELQLELTVDRLLGEKGLSPSFNQSGGEASSRP
jgi:SAM-dependent methyltransferase